MNTPEETAQPQPAQTGQAASQAEPVKNAVRFEEDSLVLKIGTDLKTRLRDFAEQTHTSFNELGRAAFEAFLKDKDTKSYAVERLAREMANRGISLKEMSEALRSQPHK